MLRLAAALFCLTTGASAQTLSLSPAPTGARTITVAGQAEASAPADHAVLRFEVVTEGVALDETLALHEREVARVRALLRDAGVPDAQVMLDRVSIDDEDEDGSIFGSDEPSEVVRVTRAVTAEVDDLDAVDGLVGALASREDDTALTAQIRTVTVAFARRDVSALRDAALRDAVADARRRADLMAGASGVRVVRVLSVSEGGVASGILPALASIGRFASLLGGLANGGSGEHTETAQVSVVYEVE